jgi:hypothetical protein
MMSYMKKKSNDRYKDILSNIDSCHRWKGVSMGNYPTVSVSGKTFRLSRLIYWLYNGINPKNKIVRHTCDNPWCVNYEHLILGTPKENAADRGERGRHADVRGELNPGAKLTWSKVREMRANPAGQNVKQLAGKYGVDRTTIYRILKNKLWETDDCNESKNSRRHGVGKQ